MIIPEQDPGSGQLKSLDTTGCGSTAQENTLMEELVRYIG